MNSLREFLEKQMEPLFQGRPKTQADVIFFFSSLCTLFFPIHAYADSITCITLCTLGALRVLHMLKISCPSYDIKEHQMGFVWKRSYHIIEAEQSK